jgi:hypothetical protein
MNKKREELQRLKNQKKQEIYERLKKIQELSQAKDVGADVVSITLYHESILAYVHMYARVSVFKVYIILRCCLRPWVPFCAMKKLRLLGFILGHKYVYLCATSVCLSE